LQVVGPSLEDSSYTRTLFENGLRVPDELCAHDPGPSTITQQQRQRGLNSSSASGTPEATRTQYPSRSYGSYPANERLHARASNALVVSGLTGCQALRDKRPIDEVPRADTIQVGHAPAGRCLILVPLCGTPRRHYRARIDPWRNFPNGWARRHLGTVAIWTGDA
jgi:hypothetical protein